MYQRREEIRRRLESEGRVLARELALVYGVSQETIRKDFEALSGIEGIERFHGGLKKDNHRMAGYHYQYRQSVSVNVDEKKRIAFKAFQLIEEGDWVYLDGGTTVSYLFNHLALRKGITFITPNLILLMRYLTEDLEAVFKKQAHRLIFVGGEISPNIYTTHGVHFNKGLEDFNFDKIFFSVDGIDLRGGMTNSDETPYEIIQQVRGRAKERILLVDHSKFGGVGQRIAMQFKDLDYLITDERLETPWLKLMKTHGITYVKA